MKTTLHNTISNEAKPPSNTKLFFQPKLTINASGDVYEQEADAMADKVMRMPDTSVNNNFFFKPAINSVQLKCAHCEEEEKKEVQRKEADNNETVADTSTENYISSLNGKGRSLTQSERSFFEPRFGYDFSDVQLHTNADAAQSAKSIKALAYTHGNNIVFGSNQYQPNSESGKRLIAHELTHVVQQNAGNINRCIIQRITVSSAGNPVDGLCGEFERKFTFTLDNPAPTDGYMIQQIDRYDNEVNCPGMGVCPANPTVTFWEAFFVTSGSTTFYRQGIGFTDSSSHNSRPNKSGARYAFGEIRFFPIAVTGDLGRNRVAGLWSPGNAGGAAPSGNLPSVNSEPAWWGNYTEGPAKRYVTADWRCCSDDNNYNVIKSSV